MQPVWVIVKAIEIIERRRARGLVMTQPGAIRMKIPWQGPRPYGQAGTGPLTVAVTQGRQDPSPMIVQAIDRIGRARRLQARLGGRTVISAVTDLADHLGHRAGKRGPGPRGQAPKPLRELPCSCCLLPAPSPIEDLAAQGTPAAFLELEEGVQEAEHQRELG